VQWFIDTAAAWPLILVFLGAVFGIDQAVRWWRANEWRRRRDDDDDDWPLAT